MVGLTIAGLVNPFRNNKLEFDLDKLRQMKSSIEKTSKDLVATKTALVQSLEDLRRKWNTPAGRKFYEETVNTNWVNNVDRYVGILEAVAELLQEAISNYAEVENEIEKIKLQ